jgi:hypothetical protein
MSETFHILQPTNRILSAEEVLEMLCDAVDGGHVHGIKSPINANPHFAAKLLDHAGLITLARGR